MPITLCSQIKMYSYSFEKNTRIIYTIALPSGRFLRRAQSKKRLISLSSSRRRHIHLGERSLNLDRIGDQ